MSTRQIASYYLWDPHSLKISNGLPYGMTTTRFLIKTLVYNTSLCPNFASLLASSLRISKKTTTRVLVILLSKYGSSHTVFMWKVTQLSHAMFNNWNVTQWSPYMGCIRIFSEAAQKQCLKYNSLLGDLLLKSYIILLLSLSHKFNLHHYYQATALLKKIPIALFLFLYSI